MTPMDRLKQMKEAAAQGTGTKQRKLTDAELAALREGRPLAWDPAGDAAATRQPDRSDEARLKARVDHLEKLTARLQERVAAQAELLAKKAEKRPRPPGPAERDRRHQKKGRLPDGASFVVVYSGSTRTWSGALTVPHGPKEGGRQEHRRFAGEEDGVFKLLARLDDQYRASLKTEATGGEETRVAEGVQEDAGPAAGADGAGGGEEPAGDDFGGPPAVHPAGPDVP